MRHSVPRRDPCPGMAWARPHCLDRAPAFPLIHRRGRTKWAEQARGQRRGVHLLGAPAARHPERRRRREGLCAAAGRHPQRAWRQEPGLRRLPRPTGDSPLCHRVVKEFEATPMHEIFGPRHDDAWGTHRAAVIVPVQLFVNNVLRFSLSDSTDGFSCKTITLCEAMLL
jgi:hypothetical protein